MVGSVVVVSITLWASLIFQISQFFDKGPAQSSEDLNNHLKVAMYTLYLHGTLFEPSMGFRRQEVFFFDLGRLAWTRNARSGAA